MKFKMGCGEQGILEFLVKAVKLQLIWNIATIRGQQYLCSEMYFLLPPANAPHPLCVRGSVFYAGGKVWNAT